MTFFKHQTISPTIGYNTTYNLTLFDVCDKNELIYKNEWYIYQSFVIPFILIGSMFLLRDCLKARAVENPTHFYKVISFNLFLLFLLNKIGLQFIDMSVTKTNMFKVGTLISIQLLFLIFFFVVHYILHRWFFSTVHFLHHEMINPTAMGALFCHPIEFIVGNWIPGVIGIVFIQMLHQNFPTLFSPIHLYTIIFWNHLACIATLFAHCGIKNYSWDQDRHLTHHKQKNMHFGFLGLIDTFYFSKKKQQKTMKL